MYFKFIVVGIGSMLITLLVLCLPFMRFKDETNDYKINNQPVIEIKNENKKYEGNVNDTFCYGSLGNKFKTYIVINENKFEIEKDLCKSINVNSHIIVEYNEQLKIVNIKYK